MRKKLRRLKKIILKKDLTNFPKETFKAFEKMKREAFNDGIRIKIVSGHRDFERQTLIWNSKFLKFTLLLNLSSFELCSSIN